MSKPIYAIWVVSWQNQKTDLCALVSEDSAWALSIRPVWSESSQCAQWVDVSSCGQRRLCSAYAQADLSLHWAQMLFCWFGHAAAHMRSTEDSIMFLHADSKDSDQTGRMPRLIWVFTGRRCHFVGFVMLQLRCDQQRCRSKQSYWLPIYEPRHEKTVFGIFDQVRLKPICSATETS